jgi:HD-like signal output (HDOD) protein
MIGLDLRSKPSEESSPLSRTAATGKEDADTRTTPEAEGLLSGEKLKKKILRTVKDLPPMPQTTFKAFELIKNPHSSYEDLAKVLETDQAIATRVLRMANSPYYGMSGKVSSIKYASAVLGLKTIEELIVMAGSSKVLGKRLEGYGMEAGDLWQHSLGVAFGSKIIASKKNPSMANDAFSAGLIHDVGKLALDLYILERKQVFTTFLSSNGNGTFLHAEREILGFDHAEIAYELCINWDVPQSLAAAIRCHHNPSLSSGNQLTYIVHVADLIAMMSGVGAGIDGMQYSMDEKALAILGMEPDDLNTIMVQVVESVQKITADMQQT